MKEDFSSHTDINVDIEKAITVGLLEAIKGLISVVDRHISKDKEDKDFLKKDDVNNKDVSILAN